MNYQEPEHQIPVLKLKIQEPVRDRTEEITAPVDTGFSGYLLLTKNLYNRLGTAELPITEFATYATMVGSVLLRRARVSVRVGQERFESYVETPEYGSGRILAGRRILSRLSLALLGRDRRCCQLVKA